MWARVELENIIGNDHEGMYNTLMVDTMEIKWKNRKFVFNQRRRASNV